MKKLIIFFSFFLSFVSYTSAEEAILIGGVSIKLGANKADVLQKLEKYNKLVESEESKGTFNIIDRNEGFIGYVYFKQDKVNAAHKSWGNYYENQGKEVIKSLIGAISTIPEDRRIAFVSTYRTFTPGLTMEDINLSFGKRDIQIVLIERKGVTSIQIDEYLRIQFP